MVPGVEGSSPFTHPTKRNEGSGVSRSLIPFHTGVSPSGKARDFDSLIRWFESSHPCQVFSDDTVLTITAYASLAQLAEHLPFKQGVRGSNPRRGTKRGRYLLVSFSFAVLPPGSRSLYLLPAESAAGLFSLRRQLQQGLFIVRRSVQHGVQQILQRITDLSPPQPQRHQVAALHRQVLQ